MPYSRIMSHYSGKRPCTVHKTPNHLKVASWPTHKRESQHELRATPLELLWIHWTRLGFDEQVLCYIFMSRQPISPSHQKCLNQPDGKEGIAWPGYINCFQLQVTALGFHILFPRKWWEKSLYPTISIIETGNKFMFYCFKLFIFSELVTSVWTECLCADFLKANVIT